jgi:hypothetical protein
MNEKEREAALRTALLVVLDHVDYTNDACTPTEMVGAVLPREVIAMAHRALRETASLEEPAPVKSQSDWTYVEFLQDGHRRLVLLVDLDEGRRSVTNDMDNVVADLIAQDLLRPESILIYRDSMGFYDQAMVVDGRFVDFRGLRGRRTLKDAAEEVGFDLGQCLPNRGRLNMDEFVKYMGDAND